MFKSETDPEVFAHLIEAAYQGAPTSACGSATTAGDLMAAVREACTLGVGAFGLAAVCADEPGVIAVARKDSPIVVGRGERGSYVASDVIARDTLVGRLASSGELDIDELGLTPEELSLVDRVYVIACGTSYHAGLIA